MDQDYAVAQADMEEFYVQGDGLPEDCVEVRQRCEEEAFQGNVRSRQRQDRPQAEGHGAPQEDGAEARARCASFGIRAFAGPRHPQEPVGAEAMARLEKAASQGDAEAQVRLGVLHELGHGVPRNWLKARMWYTRAAVRGSCEAQNNLGLIYALGLGVPADARMAIEWFVKAAGQGYAEAQNNLGAVYMTCQGIPQDTWEARRCFASAANQGHADAQFNLAHLDRYYS